MLRWGQSLGVALFIYEELTMTRHSALPNSELHEPKHFQLATGGASDVGKVVVSKGDGTSELRILTALEVGAESQLTKRKLVNVIGDLPTAVGGVITLPATTEFFFGDKVFFTNDRLVLGNFTVLKGIDTDSANLDYEGTLPFITTSDVSYLVEDLTIKCENSIVFSHTDTAARFIRYRNLCITTADGVGSYTSTGSSVLLVETLIQTITTEDGFAFAGNWNIVQFNTISDIQVDKFLFDFGTATITSLGIEQASVFMVTASSGFIKGAAASANIDAGGLARVNNCSITDIGGGTVLSGVAEEDLRWRFFNNSLIRDTRPDALASFNGNTTETVIATAGVAVEILATYTIANNTQFTVSTSGRATFDGEIDDRLPITASINAKMASGSTKNLLAFIAINGTVVADSQQPIAPTNTVSESATVIWQHTFTKTDFVELFISNEDDTVNVIVNSAVFRIN